MPDKDASNVSELIALSKKHPLHWFIRDVVLEDAIHTFHGAEETYKTMLTLQLHESLALGTRFLGRKVNGRYRTGIVELEMKPRQFGHRLAAFFTHTMPEIEVLPEVLREYLLSCRSARERIEVIADWAAGETLDFLSIDSMSKLFPAGYDTNEQTAVSDIFNQLQRLPTTWLLGHDRKPWHGIKAVGNDEIVGSGRFKQDPDIVHQMIRPDARAPVAQFHWGKMRAGEKPSPVMLFFDRVEYRLFPFHPYLHLLERKAMSGISLVEEAEARFGWKERRAREYLETLKELIAAPGKPIVSQSFSGHAKVFEINKSAKFAMPLTIHGDLVQACNKVGGYIRGASLAEAAEE